MAESSSSDPVAYHARISLHAPFTAMLRCVDVVEIAKGHATVDQVINVRQLITSITTVILSALTRGRNSCQCSQYRWINEKHAPGRRADAVDDNNEEFR